MKYWETPEIGQPPKREAANAPRRVVTSGGDLSQSRFLRHFYEHQAEISGGVQKFLFFVVIATLIYVFILGDAGAFRIMALRKERTALQTEIAMQKVDIANLQGAINRLKNDSFMIEKLGRERYGYAAPGERVYKLVPSDGGKQRAVAPPSK